VVPGGELRVHLLFNCKLRARPEPPFTSAAPIVGELWSSLPFEGKAVFRAHMDIARLALRLPDGSDLSGARVHRILPGETAESIEELPRLEGHYTVITEVKAGQSIELSFPLRRYVTSETAAGKTYEARWKGSTVVGLKPGGKRVPLYAKRNRFLAQDAPLAGSRYP